MKVYDIIKMYALNRTLSDGFDPDDGGTWGYRDHCNFQSGDMPNFRHVPT